MPIGTRHDLTGLLLDGVPFPVLRIAEGGEWRLDISKRYTHLLGKRVQITGTRAGFDLIDAERIVGT